MMRVAFQDSAVSNRERERERDTEAEGEREGGRGGVGAAEGLRIFTLLQI